MISPLAWRSTRALGIAAIALSVMVPATFARGGGGTTTPPPPSVSILPTTAPAPGVLHRESFGMADGYRPAGGKGDLKAVPLHTTLGGFWMEYPGTKNSQWLTPNANQTWKFAACSDDPWEMASPLQAVGNGCIVSEWFDPVTSYPTALQPFVAPATDYELSMDGYPAPIPGGYIGLGFTGSGATVSNLATSGALWLRVTLPVPDATVPLSYELRTGGMTGAILASGQMGYAGFNRMALRYSPATSTVTLTIDGTLIGSYAAPMAPPKYVAFEGVGVMDNFVVRQ